MKFLIIVLGVAGVLLNIATDWQLYYAGVYSTRQAGNWIMLIAPCVAIISIGIWSYNHDDIKGLLATLITECITIAVSATLWKWSFSATPIFSDKTFFLSFGWLQFFAPLPICGLLWFILICFYAFKKSHYHNSKP